MRVSNGGPMTNYGYVVSVLKKEYALTGVDTANELGGVLHGEWQEEFKKNNPEDLDRFKIVKDEEWAKQYKELCTESGEITINRNTEKEQIIKVKKSPDDKVAIDEEGKVYLDILNSSYAELSNDWKGENKESAEAAILGMREWSNIESGEKFNSRTRDNIANEIHKKWLVRV